MRHIVINLAAHIPRRPPKAFAELAVFDARLHIRVRRIDKPAQRGGVRGGARVVLASTLLVVSVSRATCQQTSEIRATAEAAIRTADAAGLKAAQAKDVVGATSNYADDASWLPPHAPLVQGKEAIRSAWTQFLGTAGLKIDWQITKIDVSRAGDMAYALYKYQMTMSTPNGAPIDDRGKDMAVWVKQSDSKWKMVADSFNSDVPLLSGTSK